MKSNYAKVGHMKPQFVRPMCDPGIRNPLDVFKIRGGVVGPLGLEPKLV